MGKAKKNVQEDNFSFVVDLKTVLALKPEHRVKWLQKACRAVGEGEASVKHVFDVLTNRKLVHGMPTKCGQRMFRMLQDNLYLFSEKQQRYLQEESAIATEFDVRSEDEAPTGAEASAVDVGGGSSGGGGAALDAATKMEEMMARCRDFVRQKASTFDERAKEAQETEKRAEEERKRAAEEQRKREWDAIDKWHRQLEDWESACMAALDERFARLLVLQRRADAEAAEAAAAGQEALKANMQAANKSRKRRSSESSGDDDAAVFKSSRRRRSGSRSRDRGRRRRESSPKGSGGSAVTPALSTSAAEESRLGEGRKSSRRKFTEDSLDPRQRQSIAQAEEHAQAQLKVQEEMQKVLGQVAGNAVHQGRERMGAPPPVGGTLAQMLRGGGGR